MIEWTQERVDHFRRWAMEEHGITILSVSQTLKGEYLIEMSGPEGFKGDEVLKQYMDEFDD